ncbi:histone deacetylase 8-like [Dendronephthya gigantea]|uniref:histone deacetylase 8-like n=1 Tax=Dendronephthya gigantea TaxID=151771 RepID=UPI001068FE82|nr:histone deacetylase 8-like [Dendronephthya gigantea]
MSAENKIAYIHSDLFLTYCNKLPKVKQRASIVHSLIEAYGLLKLENISIVEPEAATVHDLTRFHSKDYVTCLQKASECCDDSEMEDDFEAYGIGFDCPSFEDFYDCLSNIAGGTLKAAQCLNNKSHSIAINWAGGWHHAHRDEAAGFCYVNDIVLGILKLKERFPKVLYIDLDLHHGDGVQEAFFHTPSVFTLSFHKYAAGFFPGTGSCFEVGEGKGKHHTLNIPLLDGINDKLFAEIVKLVVKDVNSYFQPDAIVCQCGVDGLAGDPMNSFNLTQYGLAACVHYISSLQRPLLLLGGGGYNFPNAARCWTYITAMLLNRKLPSNIPEHEFFLKYGPDYSLEIAPHDFRPNKNSGRYIKGVLSVFKGNLEKMADVWNSK